VDPVHCGGPRTRAQCFRVTPCISYKKAKKHVQVNKVIVVVVVVVVVMTMPKWFNPLLPRVTCVIFACATNADIWQAIIVYATESQKNCSKSP